MSFPDEPQIPLDDGAYLSSLGGTERDSDKDRCIEVDRARVRSFVQSPPVAMEAYLISKDGRQWQPSKQPVIKQSGENNLAIPDDHGNIDEVKRVKAQLQDMHPAEERSQGIIRSKSIKPEKVERQGASESSATPRIRTDMALSSTSALAHDYHVSDLASSSSCSLEANRLPEKNEPRVNTVGEKKKTEDDSQSEIQSILEQFDEHANGDDKEVISSKMTNLVPALHPPRKSSLEPIMPVSPSFVPDKSEESNTYPSSYLNDLAEMPRDVSSPYKPSKASSIRSLSFAQSGRLGSIDNNAPGSPMSPVSFQKTLPPVPDLDPDLPFDFHRFLEQLRNRTADPVAKFLRSFLVEFGKKQWMVHEQVKIVSDFLTFITSKMAQCEVWRDVSDAEFDNAKEGMEKLVMNRLYSQTFSPAIPSPVHIPTAKAKRKAVESSSVVFGRRGQHQEDIERDEVLAQKVRIYGWVHEEHLDIPPVGDNGRRFLTLAQQELLKIKSYRAPRDKVICVLNCCKVIFGLLRNSKSADTSADSFVPLLIYVVLQANPQHLVSNVQYILRFRNQDKLGGEAGYYLSSLLGAIQFIENLDRTALTVSDEDFERNVEASVSAIAERNKQEDTQLPELAQSSDMSNPSQRDPTPSGSMEGETGHAARPSSRPNPLDGADEKVAITGLLRTIQRPLSSIGRIFSDESTSLQSPGNLKVHEVPAHPPETPRRLSPAVFQLPRNSNDLRRSVDEPRSRTPRLGAEDAAARQASAEAAEAHRIQRNEHKDVVETLASMFPDLDKDIIDDVVRMKEGRVGLAVEACLALNS